MRKIIRINVRTDKISIEHASDELRRICGRHFIARVMNQEVEPTCEPLGRRNKFIISQGWFSDTNLSTTGKISIGGKSPLTGGIKESNTGGHFGKRLSKLGIKAVILEDTPDKGISTRVIIHLFKQNQSDRYTRAAIQACIRYDPAAEGTVWQQYRHPLHRPCGRAEDGGCRRCLPGR